MEGDDKFANNVFYVKPDNRMTILLSFALDKSAKTVGWKMMRLDEGDFRVKLVMSKYTRSIYVQMFPLRP